MQIALFKQRHLNERLKKENAELQQENQELAHKVEVMRQIMIQFDHERLEVDGHTEVS